MVGVIILLFVALILADIINIQQLPVFFLAFVIGLLAIYLVVKYLLEAFVLRKIKLIYKIISTSKFVTDHKPSASDSKSLDEVNDEVIEWARKTNLELKNLKSLADYRKNFVGNISHELKTPIFSVQGYLHTLLEGGMYDENINQHYLERALRNTERLQTIVEELEVISTLEGDTEILNFEDFDLRLLCDEVREDLKVQANADHVTIEYKEGVDHHFSVFADRENIRRVLNNLIINSIKYGKEGGTTKVSFYDMDSKILTEISDDGIGIDDTHLKHLFDRFYRVDASRSRELGGSGLGLSIVKHIIEAHRGNINVRSTSNVGSTFGFTLTKAQKS